MEQQTDICDKCNKPKGGKSSGSITQWVLGATTCHCDAPTPPGISVLANSASSGSAAVTICPRCKRPEHKSVRERGSLTQWVLRSNSCTCRDVASEGLSQGATEPDAGPLNHVDREQPGDEPPEDQSGLSENEDLQDLEDDDSGLLVKGEDKVKSNERNFAPFAVMLLLVVLIGGTAAMVSSFLDRPALPEQPTGVATESETVDEKWDRAVKIMDTNIMPAYSSIAEADLKRLRGGGDLLQGEPDLVLRGTGVTDGDLVKLSSCDKLGELDLSETRISDAAIPYVVQANSIRKLLLNGVKLEPSSLGRLASMPLLEELQLDNSGLTDAHLDVLSRLRRLRILKVSNNRAITDGGVRKLTKLSNLRVLDIAGTEVSVNTSRMFSGVNVIKVIDPSRTAPQKVRSSP